MLNPRSGILLIALGSIIVIAGIAMYIFEIFGYTGMILIGVAVELYGGITFLRHLRKNKNKKQQ
ncbi:hypothetical protein [Nonlabens antarcticus]|uniref:hypothetical protein n=1 Tax=Nonlabens antarcticus TaxID=392714 RepID=UPI001891F082|nr:hypothetical protein [Nonlabens antarcticus]